MTAPAKRRRDPAEGARSPGVSERAARLRRLARPQLSVELICDHRFFYRGIVPKSGDAVWCTRCSLPSQVADVERPS